MIKMLVCQVEQLKQENMHMHQILAAAGRDVESSSDESSSEESSSDGSSTEMLKMLVCQMKQLKMENESLQQQIAVMRHFGEIDEESTEAVVFYVDSDDSSDSSDSDEDQAKG